MTTAYAKEPLPPGWEMKYDWGTKKFFYIDHTTKKTTWEDPRKTLLKQIQNAAEAEIHECSSTSSAGNSSESSTYADHLVDELVRDYPEFPRENIVMIMESCGYNKAKCREKLDKDLCELLEIDKAKITSKENERKHKEEERARIEKEIIRKEQEEKKRHEEEFKKRLKEEEMKRKQEEEMHRKREAEERKKRAEADEKKKREELRKREIEIEEKRKRNEEMHKKFEEDRKREELEWEKKRESMFQGINLDENKSNAKFKSTSANVAASRNNDDNKVRKSPYFKGHNPDLAKGPNRNLYKGHDSSLAKGPAIRLS